MLPSGLRRLSHSRPALVAGLVAGIAVTVILYVWRLGEAPIYISNGEVHFAIHAESIARTGRDLNGMRFPLFFDMIDPLLPDNGATEWWQPVLFYATSASLLVFPFAEGSVRLSIAIIGVINVALIYAIARQRLESRTLGIAAAALMALTPAHFVMSRQAVDYLCPGPFALMWLWFLGGFLRRQDTRLLAAAGAALGIGTFTHISAWALMPMFAAMTVGVLALTTRARRAWLAFSAGLLVPWTLAAAWLLTHPGVMKHVFGRYFAAPADTARAASISIGKAASLYWDYFSPSFLFFSGGSDPTLATSRAGVFLLPLLVLLPLGVAALLRGRRAAIDFVPLAAFLLAPVPVIVVLGAEGGYSIARPIMLVPFGVLLASHGVAWLWHHGSRARILLAALLVFAPAQFALFADDYFSDYQIRTARRFDALNTGGAAAVVFAEDDRARIPVVYLSDDLDSKAVRWRFHLWKAHRYDLWLRTRYLTTALVDAGLERGSVVVLFEDDPQVKTFLASGNFDRLAAVTHPAGDGASAVLIRRR